MNIISINDELRQATIEVITQMGISHTIELQATSENYFYSRSQSSPLHPHISGSRICLDSDVKSAIYYLLHDDKFRDAVTMLGVALEVVNMNSAYGDRYNHLSSCHLCGEWVEKRLISRCISCDTRFCPKCASKCECGDNFLAICKSCFSASSKKCIYCTIETKLNGEKTIYRLNLDPSILRILEKEVKTIKDLDIAINENRKITGIGKIKLEQIKSVREAYSPATSNS